MKTELIWEQLTEKGLEHLVLEQDKAIVADSMALGVIDDTAYRIAYQILCDLNWRVERIRI